MVFSTFLGGSSNDRIIGITIDDEGTSYFVGRTHSDDLPCTDNAYDWTRGGGMDTFVGRLSSNGTTLEYLTYLGGTRKDQCGFGGIVRGLSNTTVVGSTESTDYPTTPGSYMTSKKGLRDIFITRLETEPPNGTLPSAPLNLTVDNRTKSVYLSWEERCPNT